MGTSTRAQLFVPTGRTPFAQLGGSTALHAGLLSISWLGACTHPAVEPRPVDLTGPTTEIAARDQHYANRADDPRATTRSFTVAPGEFVDLNANFEADARIAVAYCGASEATIWKVITFAPNGEIAIYERGRGSAGELVFTAPAAGHYSMRWINGGTTTMTLDAAVELGEGAKLHSWVQSWVPRDGA